MPDDDRAVISMLGDLKGDAPSAMIRRGDWKLVSHHGDERDQLFDLRHDSREIQDRGGDPAYADVRESLNAALHKVWDGAATAANVAHSLKHQALFHDWVVVTGAEDREQWYPEPGTDYLITRET